MFVDQVYRSPSGKADYRWAREVALGCACIEGCPGCVGPPPAPGLGLKAAVLDALEVLCAQPSEAGAA